MANRGKLIETGIYLTASGRYQAVVAYDDPDLSYRPQSQRTFHDLNGARRWRLEECIRRQKSDTPVGHLTVAELLGLYIERQIGDGHWAAGQTIDANLSYTRLHVVPGLGHKAWRWTSAP